jgi:primosomal protein N' (replication factor Y)
VETYHCTVRGDITRLALPERIGAPLPPVEIVDMREELRAGNRSILSWRLQDALSAALAAHEQAILFLNRRGTATFVQCRDCGHVLKCLRCQLPLTLHGDAGELICHHCNYQMPVPGVCPVCWSQRIKQFGAGTQKVEQVVREMFPRARLVRWDRDTTGGKTAHEDLLDRFIRHEADVMIGTQMIAKGLDLPLVTLVGVIAADTALHLPDFRAGERTFQLLTQVAGRAGRSERGGTAIFQTYSPDHYAVRAAARHDYELFYKKEIEYRRQLGYPPFSRLIKLTYPHKGEAKAKQEAERLAQALANKILRLGLPALDLIGPAPAFIPRLRGEYRWQIVIRGENPHRLIEDAILPLGWRVDVDPVSLL